MCVLTVTHAVTAEVLVRYEDATVHVAYELACGCVRLRPATLADLERGLPLVEDGEPDCKGALGTVVGSAWEDGSDDPVLPLAA
jgi:hypothetical protein